MSNPIISDSDPGRVYGESNECLPDSDERTEISILDLLIVIAKHKVMIISVTVGAALLSLVYSLVLPNIYTGTTRLLPPQQSTSTASMMLGQLGQLSGLANTAGTSLGIKNPNDLYVGMLKSRTVADNIIVRFDLKSLYRANTMVEARTSLADRTTVAAGKDGLIMIEFDDTDPKRAAAIANAFVFELDRLTQSLAVTEAAQRRLFFERQLLRAKDELVNAEIAARSALEKGGVAMVDEQGRSMIQSIARLRAQITAKEVEISAMGGFASDQNPDLGRARQELAALRLQLGKLEGTGTPFGALVEKGKGQGLKNLGLLRDLRYNEVLFELLAKQYEIAKIDEAKEAAVIQVVDEAVIPDRKSKPKRASIVIMAILIACLAALLWAFVREARERASADPKQFARLTALRRYASFR